jgi:hypothetical protein
MSEQVETMQATTGAELRAKARRYVRCPSNATYLMRRATFSALLQADTLPENFVSDTLRSIQEAKAEHGEQPTEVPEVKTTDKDLAFMEESARILITASMLKPRIVPQAEADDEIEYGDIPAEDRRYLNTWLRGEAPDSYLDLQDGGEVSVGALHTFPDGKEGGASAVAGAGSEARGAEVESAIGAE